MSLGPTLPPAPEWARETSGVGGDGPPPTVTFPVAPFKEVPALRPRCEVIAPPSLIPEPRATNHTLCTQQPGGQAQPVLWELDSGGGWFLLDPVPAISGPRAKSRSGILPWAPALASEWEWGGAG